MVKPNSVFKHVEIILRLQTVYLLHSLFFELFSIILILREEKLQVKYSFKHEFLKQAFMFFYHVSVIKKNNKYDNLLNIKG